jgi:hypothetical protein
VRYATPAQRRLRLRRWTETVVGGLAMIGTALGLSAARFAPDQVTTGGALVGFGLVVFGTTASFSVLLDVDTEHSTDFDR